MNERRATVVLLQRGDPQIAGAIADGMLAARAAGNELPEEHAGALEIVSGEMDPERRRVLTHLVRVAVGNTLTPEDYARMTRSARRKYGAGKPPGALRRLGRQLSALYALLVYGLIWAYRQQDRVLCPREGRREP